MHFGLLWRDMMKSLGSVENEQYFRLITGEAHPLGHPVYLRLGLGDVESISMFVRMPS